MTPRCNILFSIMLCLSLIAHGGCSGGTRGSGITGVRGRIISSETQQAIAGLLVTAVGQNVSTVTDEDGNFTFNISSTGVPLELRVSGSPINVTFRTDTVPLDTALVSILLEIDEENNTVDGEFEFTPREPDTPIEEDPPPPSPLPSLSPSPKASVPLPNTSQAPSPSPSSSPSASTSPARPPGAPRVLNSDQLTRVQQITIQGEKDPGTSIILNNTVLVSSNSESTWTANITLAEGPNLFEFFSEDLFGQRSTGRVYSITLDTIAPSQPVVTNAPSTTTLSLVTLSGTKEADSNVYLDGNVIVTNTAETTWTADVLLDSIKIHQLAFSSFDLAGNESSSLGVQISRRPTQGRVLWSDNNRGMAQSLSVDQTGRQIFIQDYISLERCIPNADFTGIFWPDHSGATLFYQARNSDNYTVLHELQNSSEFIGNLTYDSSRDEFFYAGRNSRKLYKLENTTGTITALTSQVNDYTAVTAIQFNRSDDKIYWADLDGFNTISYIYRVNRDGSGLEQIHSMRGLIRDIGFDHAAQKIIWAQSPFGGFPDPAGFIRASFDGSSQELLYENSFVLNKMAVDETNNEIYWDEFDGLHRGSIDGSTSESILGTMDAETFFFDHTRNSLLGVDENNENPSIYTLFNFDLSQLQKETLISSSLSAPFGLAFSESQLQVYWLEWVLFKGSVIRRANLDTSSVETLLTLPTDTASDLIVDETNEKYYWLNGSSAQELRSSNFTGTDIKSLTGTTGAFYALAYDPPSNSLFLSENDFRGTLSIVKYELNTDTVTRPITSTVGFPASDVVVDSTRRKVYWSKHMEDRIRRANLDGSDIEDVVSTTRPTGLMIDEENAKLYWFDDTNKQIMRSNLDGSQVEVFDNSHVRTANHMTLIK